MSENQNDFRSRQIHDLSLAYVSIVTGDMKVSLDAVYGTPLRDPVLKKIAEEYEIAYSYFNSTISH